MNVQRTIKRSGELEGIGLQTGKNIGIVFKPAPADTGIVFLVRSKETNEKTRIKASIENLVGVNHSTVLGLDGTVLHTVEHLLAALWGVKLNNIYIEVCGCEVPILDGSCQPFVEFIQSLGIEFQSVPLRYIRIEKEFSVGSRERYIKAYPSESFRVDYEIFFDHPVIRRQKYTLNSDLSSFFSEIAPARTFGFLKEIKPLRKKGLLKGGSLKNAVVIGRNRVLNSDLRFRDEFVRHKILDALGDFMLLQYPLLGHVEIYRGGHSLHTSFIRRLMEQPELWSWVGHSGINTLNNPFNVSSQEHPANYMPV